MSFTSALFKTVFKIGDIIRDRGLTTPETITRHDDMDYYGDNTEDHLLDVYYPLGTEALLPVIISVHGGGWVYGNKEVYQYYCMTLAEYGFTIINFNYRLAPHHKFPAALEDVNAVFHWIKGNSSTFHMDLNHVFIIGDSAGAQIATQYAAILTNEAYANLFGLEIPDVNIKALGLHCGLFDPLDRLGSKDEKRWARLFLNRLMKDYLGKDVHQYDKEMDVQSHIVRAFPPSFITCSVNDRLVGVKPALLDRLKNVGADFRYKEYGHHDTSLQHVFHIDIKKAEARKHLDDQIQFFSKWIHA